MCSWPKTSSSVWKTPRPEKLLWKWSYCEDVTENIFLGRCSRPYNLVGLLVVVYYTAVTSQSLLRLGHVTEGSVRMFALLTSQKWAAASSPRLQEMWQRCHVSGLWSPLIYELQMFQQPRAETHAGTKSLACSPRLVRVLPKHETNPTFYQKTFKSSSQNSITDWPAKMVCPHWNSSISNIIQMFGLF